METLTPATGFSLLWLIPGLPLLGAAIGGFGGHFLMKRFGPKANHTIAIILPTISFVITVYALLQLIGLPDGKKALHQNLFPFIHIGLFDADMAFWFDPLSATLCLIITFVGTLIHVYSVGYMKDDEAYWRFFSYLNLFMAMMLILVLGDNFMVMFIGWEGVGLCSYLLIAFWYKQRANAVAGMKAFVVNRVGDFAFVLGLAFLFWGMMGDFAGADSLSEVQYDTGFYGTGLVSIEEQTLLTEQASDPEYYQKHAELAFREGSAAPASSLRFDAIRAIIHRDSPQWDAKSPKAKTFMGISLATLICILLFIAATGKSAQIPLFVWLPDAMAGPTPVSALIHAATMVTAGVYLVARMGFLYALSPIAMTVVTVVGVCTALLAATIGLFQYDIKKVLAYSTISQLGYMFIGVGTGAYWAGIYHLLTHALFKATLFLCSGSVILGCHHEQDMRRMGGLKQLMPSTAWTYLIACIAITAAPFPFTFVASGFFSKDEILWKAFDAGHLMVPGWMIWVPGIIGAACTSFYMWRSYYMTFTGDYRGSDHGDGDSLLPKESPRSMTWVLWTLACLTFVSIGLGFWPLLLHNKPIFELWLAPVVGSATESLTWLSHDSEHLLAGQLMKTWELALAVASVLLTSLAWWSARVLYKDAKSTIPERLKQSTSVSIAVPYNLIFNKYYVDEVYDVLVVRRVRDLARFAYAFDQTIIDGLVNLAATVGRVVGMIDGLIDALVVDGLVNLIAEGFAALGRKLRQLQTGRIQTYLIGAVGGVLLLVFVNYVLHILA